MNVNEVEAAGNTPLHNAAYEGWTEGIELLIGLGATVNASNNAGDRPWHWARNMGHTAAMAALEKVCSCLLGTGTRLAVINPLLMCSTLSRLGHGALGLMCPHTKNGPVKQASGASAVHSNAKSGCAARGEPGAGPGAGTRPHPQSQGAGALPLEATKIRAYTASARHPAHAASCHADRVVLHGCCQSCTKVL